MDIIWRDTSSDVVYEEARLARVFNSHRPNHYPAAIVHAKSDSETFEAVKLAQRLKLQVSVRSGGHSYSGWSLSDNSILIDLSNYREIEVDVINQEAWISCGMKSDIDVELMREYGLMLGAGHHPDVGIGRYLLQGGLSWNCRVSSRLLFLVTPVCKNALVDNI
jgi:FAD/FMN-containing dehydrogenase